MSVVDVHAHLLLPELHAAVERYSPSGVAAAAELELRRNGAESQAHSGPMLGARIPKLTRLDARLAAMDAQGVDRQWVSVSPNHFYPWAEEGLAVWIAREANRAVAAHTAAAADRLVGLGVVPLQHPERIVECLDDAILGRGLAGVEISSFAGPAPREDGSESPRVELSDPRLEPFWARAAELGAVVFLHPFGCSLDERLDRFYLANTVGQPAENAVALSHLIFAGVLDRHPGLRVVAAHGGGYLPTAIGRSDRAWRVRPEAAGCAEPPSAYLRRLWFDTVVHDAAALRHLIEVAGADRVLLGSDFPFDMGLDDPAREVAADLAAEGFGEDEIAAVLGGSAEGLLRRSA
ncbi:amidohydrolase [Leucobacter allii]|uniref:amidohydrolase family protein n=1 Tax=Leucobacter allii TaxID=2932247 RepID=UPI001FD288E3|nr:amidohydrolase family protein [Leucobacter allii]UOR01880.1 amidohydrolase [Leucobacter allii]